MDGASLASLNDSRFAFILPPSLAPLKYFLSIAGYRIDLQSLGAEAVLRVGESAK